MPNLEYLFKLERFGIKTSLDNITRLCAELGNPQNRYPIVHIAGTNGKGSTAAMIQSILCASGYKTGLYTSPHLVNFGERIRVGREMLSDHKASDLIEELRPLFQKTESTFFESTTAMAFLHFARQKVDIAVVETGLGGSWDATNIVSPILSVFTPISLDHTDRLGREISAIASDKVGIIKSKIPVVSSWQENSALERIERKVGEQNCVFYYAPEVMELVEGKLNFRSSHITINCKTNPQLSGEYQLQLPGRHQWLNLATALTSALVLQKQGIIIKNAHLKSAVELTNWPGRLQILQEKPLVYYDVAHNPGAATVLVDFFRELFPGKKVKILLGMVKDKDYYNFLRIVSTFSSDFIFTRLPTTRTLEPEMLLQEASARDLPARVIENPAEALENSLLEAKPEDTILITGSHYLGQPILSKYLTN